MLLAKKPPRDPSIPKKELKEHSLDVFHAATILFGDAAGPTALGKAWLRFFRLEPQGWPVFHANLAAAALLHDLGKANDGFQNAMTRGGQQQLLRHEHVSALILSLPSMQDWLGSNPLLRPVLIISAVLCHHLKAAKRPPPRVRYPAFAEPYPDNDRETLVMADPDAVADLLNTVARHLQLPPAPPVPRLWTLDGSGGEDVEQARCRIERLFRPMKNHGRNDTDLLLPALKAAVVAADAAGSGLPRVGHDIGDWLREVFAVPPLEGDTIHREVLARRIGEIEQRKRRDDPAYVFAYQDFQNRAAELPQRALLLAGCGAGKTLAAWRWIAARLDARPARRVLFLYPTRATANEGFRDYVSHASEDYASLLTGTAAYELRDMFENPDDPRSGRDYETEARLFAVGAWRKRIFSATVDQFLGFMQQVYASLCLLPVLADSVVVVDEVHSFDPGLFSALIRFLKAFNVPVLCMTASLPVRRRQALEKLGFAVYPEKVSDFEALERRAQAPRYRIRCLAGRDAAKDEAIRALEAKKRVLWVVNTVERCQQLAEELGGYWPICYHSRFRLVDRNRRHREVIDRFGTEDGPLLAITTQVCEMSLDLDADVLISELAPIPALIQRMGRCNRHERTDRLFGEVYVYAPDTHLPYTVAELTVAQSFADDLAAAGQASQADLEEKLEQYSRLDPAEKDRLTAFLDDGPWARGGAEALREGQDFTVPAILTPGDLECWQPGAEGLVVPVPKRLAERDGRLPRFLHRAPASHYSEALGFRERPLDTHPGDGS